MPAPIAVIEKEPCGWRSHSNVMWTAFDNTEGRLGGRERHVVGHYRLGEPFEGERADFFERCRPFDCDGDTLSDEDLPVLGLSAKPGGEIAHGADCGIAGAVSKTDLP